MVICIPQNIWEKQLDTFGRMKFWLPLKLSYFLSQTYAASRESKIELLMLVSDFMVNSMLKILKGVFVEFMECLNTNAHLSILFSLAATHYHSFDSKALPQVLYKNTTWEVYCEDKYSTVELSAAFILRHSQMLYFSYRTSIKQCFYWDNWFWRLHFLCS